jgi:hypothetical protein
MGNLAPQTQGQEAMSARDKIAEIIATHDDTEVLHLVHPDGYCEGCKNTPCIDNSALRLADAILAAMPDMIAPLDWKIRGYKRGTYPTYITKSRTYVTEVMDYGTFLSCPQINNAIEYKDITAAWDFANAHNRAAIMAEFTTGNEPVIQTDRARIQCLIEENAALKEEIERLRRDEIAHLRWMCGKR